MFVNVRYNFEVLFVLSEENVTLFVFVAPDVEGELKDYQEQLKQMLKDLAKEKEKDVEKPLPLMNQVLETCEMSIQLRSNEKNT